jgi:hypothetical protein
MFCWPKYMLEREHLEERLGSLQTDHRIAFAAACTRHALLLFEDLRKRGDYGPSEPDFLLILLGIIDEAWVNLGRVPDESVLTSSDSKLRVLAGRNPGRGMSNENELFGATNQTLKCQKSGSAKAASRAARNVYNAVSNWFLARSFGGKAMTASEVIEFEQRDFKCQEELSFQRTCLEALEKHGGSPLTYHSLLAPKA